MKTRTKKRVLLVFLTVVLTLPLVSCQKSISENDSKKLYDDAQSKLNGLESYSVNIQRDIVLTHGDENLYNDMEKYTFVKGKDSVSLRSSEGYIKSWYYNGGIANLYIDGDGYETEMTLEGFYEYIDTLGMSGIDSSLYQSICGTPADDGTILTLSKPNGTEDVEKRLLSIGITGFEFKINDAVGEMILDKNGDPVSEKISYTGECKIAGESLVFDLIINRKYNLESATPATADTEKNSYLRVDSISEVIEYNGAFTNLLTSNFDASFSLDVLIAQVGPNPTNGDLIKESHNYVQNVSADSFSFCEFIQFSDATDPTVTGERAQAYMTYENGVLTNIYNGEKSTDNSSDPYTMLYFVTGLYGRFANSYAKMHNPVKTVNTDGDMVFTYELEENSAAKICGDMAYMLYGGSSSETITSAKDINFSKNTFQIVIDKDTKTVNEFAFFLDGTFDIESTVIRVNTSHTFKMNQYEGGVKVEMPKV